MQVKREGDVDQPSVIPTSSLILPSTSTSNSAPDTRPNLDANCSANLDDRSGTEEKRQRAAVQQEAALSPPQDPLTPLPSPPFPKHQQAVPTLILELDSVMAKPRKLPFRSHSPAPATVTFWKEHHGNAAFFGVRLSGNAQKPKEFVGIDLKDLIVHSGWFARIRKDALADIAQHGSSTKILVPLQTPHSIVSEMVESLYSGTVSLNHENVEQLLLLSHAMQVCTCTCTTVKKGLVLTMSCKQHLNRFAPTLAVCTHLLLPMDAPAWRDVWRLITDGHAYMSVCVICYTQTQFF